MQFLKILGSATLFMLLSGCATQTKDEYAKMSAEQIYTKGKRELSKKRYHTAVLDFDALETRYPYGEYTDKAQLAAIYGMYKVENFGQALAACDRFIQAHPRHPHVDYAYYMRGVINYEDNYSMSYRLFPIDRAAREAATAKTAFNDFKLLLNNFPKSKYTDDAKLRMLKLKEQIAGHNLHIAKYYFEEQAYVASSNRATQILMEFPDTLAARQAKELLAQSYIKLGQKDLAQQLQTTTNKQS